MIQQTLFTGWHFMRWLRLGLGIFMAIQAFEMHDTFSGFIAAFFLFQAITNTGCCGSNVCVAPSPSPTVATHTQDTTDDIKYEEIQ